MKTTLLSVLVPMYNESECISLLYERLTKVLTSLPCRYEILFVNDGSTDDTLFQIRELQQKDERISFIDLSRNFGKETAMCAGIDYIKGDALVIIDADLQDPPELIPQMLEEIENGYDDVYAQRKKRDGETWLKKWSSKQYYKLLDRLSDIPVQVDTGDFRMFSKQAIEALQDLKERERNMKGLFSFIGFRKKPIYYDRDPRIAGTTKWNYIKLTELAIKGLTSFSVVPLRIVSVAGLLTSIVAFIYLITVILRALLWGDPVEGYPSLMSVILFLGGFVLLALGIIGEYLGVIFNETKKRPIYYIKEYTSDVKSAKD